MIAYRRLANIINRQNDITGALNIIKKARSIFPQDFGLKNDLVKYYFKLNKDSGMYYYRKFSAEESRFLFVAAEPVGKYFVGKGDLEMAVFICKEELAHPAWPGGYSDCAWLPGYAFSKDQLAIYDTLFSIISNSDNNYVKSRMFTDVADAFQDKGDTLKAIEYSLKSLEYDPDYNYPRYDLAYRYSMLHNKEKSLYHLDKALTFGNFLFSDMQTNIKFEFIRNTKEFRELMKKYFPDEAK